jgi:hypothetical protein
VEEAQSAIIFTQKNMAPSRTSLYEVVLLAVPVTALTFAATWIYPTWDDGRLMLAIQGSGSRAIWVNFGNRPLAALFYLFLLNHQAFLPVGMVLHWMTWLGMGLVTMRFWRLMFPAHSRFALLPALLSVAPILCKVQLVILTIPSIDLLGPVLSFVAIFMLLSEQSSRLRRIIVRATALALIALSILISEYAVVTAAVGFILISAKAIRNRSGQKRELQVMAALVAVCTLISYSVFLWLTRAAGRDAFRPGHILDLSGWRLRGIPFRLLSGVWRGAIGGLLESLGSFTLNSKAALLSFVCGAIVSGLVVLAIHKREAVEFTLKQDRISVITLFAALVVALVPVVLMDRTLETRWDSRFWLPVLPVLSSLSVYILFYLLKARLYVLVPVLCGFLAGYWTTLEIANAVRNPETMVVLSHKFQSHSADFMRVDVWNNSKTGSLA